MNNKKTGQAQNKSTKSKSVRSKFDKVLNILLIGLLIYYVYRYAGLLLPSSKVDNPVQATAIMYSTRWCPFCAEARGFFALHQISYYEYDINQSEQGRNEFIALGGQGVPLIKIGKTVIHGMQRSKILQAVQGKTAVKQQQPAIKSESPAVPQNTSSH